MPTPPVQLQQGAKPTLRLQLREVAKPTPHHPFQEGAKHSPPFYLQEGTQPTHRVPLQKGAKPTPPLQLQEFLPSVPRREPISYFRKEPIILLSFRYRKYQSQASLISPRGDQAHISFPTSEGEAAHSSLGGD